MSKEIEISRSSKSHFGEFREIPFEIVRFKAFEHTGNAYSWCHYIYIYDTQLPDRDLELPEEYFTAYGTSLTSEPSWVHSLEFHGGCTYCEIDRDGHYGKLLKIGCDYQHYRDEQQNYDVRDVLIGVTNTIDSLYKVFPEILSRKSLTDKFSKRFPRENSKKSVFKYDVNGEPMVGKTK